MTSDRPTNRDAPAELSPGGGRSRLVLALQLLGFLIGLGLFGWTLSIALSPGNRAQLERLGGATLGEVALLLGLSSGTLVLNGLIFWAALVPAKRLRLADVQATNAIASFLSYLPFKLSVMARVVIHSRRDGVPVLTIGAWLGAVGVVMGVAFAPLVGASLWRKGLDPAWWAVVLGGMAALGALVVGASRAFAHERGLARIHRWFDPLPVPILHRFLRSPAFARLHAGFAMTGDARVVAGTTGVRVIDVGVQAARFVVVARILDLPIGMEEATLVASTYFLIGVVSPAGSVGTREAGVVGLCEMLEIGGGTAFATAAVIVTATESIVFALGAATGIAWLRPDRLMRLSGPAAGAHGPSAASLHPEATPIEPGGADD